MLSAFSDLKWSKNKALSTTMATTYYFDGSTFSLKVSNPEDEDSTKDQEDEEEAEKPAPKKRSTRKRKKTAKAMNADKEAKENDDSAITNEALEDQDDDNEKPPPKKKVKGKEKRWSTRKRGEVDTIKFAERGFRTEVDSSGYRVYFCNHCDFQIKQEQVSSSYVAVATRDHYNAEHLKKRLDCSICTYTTFRYKTLREHRKKYHDLNVMKCTEERCLFSSDFEADMIEHYKKDHDKIVEPSNKEKVKFTGQIGKGGQARKGMPNPKLKEYWAQKKLERGKSHKELRDYEYACKFCDFHNKDYCTVQAHASKMHTGKQMKCEFCNFSNFNKRYVVSHMKKEHNKQRESCIVPDCTFKSYLASSVQMHLFQKHHGRYDQERHSILIPIQ